MPHTRSPISSCSSRTLRQTEVAYRRSGDEKKPCPALLRGAGRPATLILTNQSRTGIPKRLGGHCTRRRVCAGQNPSLQPETLTAVPWGLMRRDPVASVAQETIGDRIGETCRGSGVAGQGRGRSITGITRHEAVQKGGKCEALAGWSSRGTEQGGICGGKHGLGHLTRPGAIFTFHVCIFSFHLSTVKICFPTCTKVSCHARSGPS